MNPSTPNTPDTPDTTVVKGKEYPAVAVRIARAMLFWSNFNGSKLTWNGLTQALNLSPGAPTNWKKGKISNETLTAIAEYTGVNTSWLITGEGKFSKENDKTNPSNEAMQIVKNVISNLKYDPEIPLEFDSLNSVEDRHYDEERHKPSQNKEQNLEHFLEQIKNKALEQIDKFDNNVRHESNSAGVKLVPLISFVQAGNFKEAILNAQDEFIATYAENLSDDAFALKIAGLSMSPEFNPNDKIVCDPNVSPIPGDYVIAQNGDNEATFKKYKPRGFDENGKEYFELVPINPDFPTMDSRFQNITVIATVVEHFRSFRSGR